MRRQLPGLDGVRAVAVGMVILSHLEATGRVHVPAMLVRFVEVGELGVRIFFVLSGFLITQLLRWETESHSLHVGRFYLRRSLRIFPPYFTYVGVVCALRAGGLLPGALTLTSVLPALTYVSGYFLLDWFLRHSWSLSIEEQFYLVWPPALRTIGRRRAFVAPLVVALLCPIVRVAMLVLHHYRDVTLVHVGRTIETGGDSIAVGCLLAYFRSSLHAQFPGYVRFLRSRKFVAIPVMVFGLYVWGENAVRWNAVLNWLGGIAIQNMGIAICLDRTILDPSGFASSLLNSRVMTVIGRLSYSLYLWQALFINPVLPGLLFIFPLNVGATFIVSGAAHILCERPFYGLRHRLRRAEEPVGLQSSAVQAPSR